MALDRVMQQIRRLIDGVPHAEETDGQLLERFAARNERAAFETLLRRHGAMVLEVSRQVLHNHHDAEEVFQVTFLALARQASTIRKHASVGSWLYGVAYRTALRARSRSERRRDQERKRAAMSPTTVDDDVSWRELGPVLAEEVGRLPEDLRSPVVLCYFEGKTREEAADQLGWSQGMVKGRLERARDLLRDRLTRRGLAVSSALLVTVFQQQASAATYPAVLAAATLKMVTLTGAGAVSLSAPVAELLEGVLQEMFWHKLKIALVLVFTLSTVGVGLGWIAHRARATPEADALALLAPAPAKDPVEDTEVVLPIDKAVVYPRVYAKDPQVVLVTNSWGDHRNIVNATMGILAKELLATEPRERVPRGGNDAEVVGGKEALELSKEGKQRVPQGGNLSILALEPYNSHFNKATVRRLTRRGQCLELVVVSVVDPMEYGPRDATPMPGKSLVQVPIDLPPGDYQLQVNWHLDASNIKGGQFKPQPVKVQKHAFTVFEGLTASKPVRVKDIEYQTLVESRLLAPPAGKKRPVLLGVRVTNHSQEPYTLPFACSIGPDGVKSLEERPVKQSGGRTSPRRTEVELPTLKPGQSGNFFVFSAALSWDKDGRSLILEGNNATGTHYRFEGLQAGTYSIQPYIDSQIQNEPVAVEIVAKP